MALNITNFAVPCPDDGQQYPFSSAKLRFSFGVTTIIYIIYFLPFCFGVFGNVSVCLIFFQQKKLRSITNTFLMNLCLNDLIVLCVSIPMTLSAALLEHWVFGAFLCKFVNFAPTLTALVSTFTVAVIAVERWFFIVNKRKFNRGCTIFTLIFLWCLSIFIALPEFVSRQIEESIPPALLSQMMTSYLSSIPTNYNASSVATHYPLPKPPCITRKISYCVLKPDLRMRIFSYIVITVQYLVPFVFVSVSCYSISRFLKRRMERMRKYQLQPHPPVSSLKRSRRNSSKHAIEIPESDFTSFEDSSSAVPTQDTKSNAFFTRFRHPFQHRENSHGLSNSVPLNDHQHYLKCQSHTERRFHRSRKLLICVAVLFTISWLPLTIVQIYLEHNGAVSSYGHNANFVYGYLLIPCYLISSISAWLNPVIYNYINRSFRREFYALYSCCLNMAKTSSSKELTSTKPRREAGQMKDPNQRLSSKHGSQAVSFADRTIVMMH